MLRASRTLPREMLLVVPEPLNAARIGQVNAAEDYARSLFGLAPRPSGQSFADMSDPVIRVKVVP